MVQLFWKTTWKVQLNIELPNGPAIPLPDVYPRERKTYLLTKTGKYVLAALSVDVPQLANG